MYLLLLEVLPDVDKISRSSIIHRWLDAVKLYITGRFKYYETITTDHLYQQQECYHDIRILGSQLNSPDLCAPLASSHPISSEAACCRMGSRYCTLRHQLKP